MRRKPIPLRPAGTAFCHQTVDPAGYRRWLSITQRSNGDFTGGDSWRAGVTLDDKIVTNPATKISVQYIDPDNVQEQVQGFVRLQRAINSFAVGIIYQHFARHVAIYR